MTCVHLLPQAKFEFKDSSIQHKKYPRICRRFFVERPKFLAATYNLRVERNLVHLGRFLHFSQKVVGVTLSTDNCKSISTKSLYHIRQNFFLFLANLQNRYRVLNVNLCACRVTDRYYDKQP